MTPITKLLAVVIIGALSAVPAYADRPLQSEDAAILDRGSCAIEGGASRGAASGSATRTTALQFDCGVGAATQLTLAVAQARADGASTRGLAVGGKTRLWQGQAAQGDEAPTLALAYGLASVKSSGDRWRHAATALNLAYSRPLANALTLHANLGHARDEIGKARATTWALALEHAGFGALAPMAEVFGDDREPAWFNLGLRYAAVAEKFFLDASWGRPLRDSRASLLTLGFKFAF